MNSFAQIERWSSSIKIFSMVKINTFYSRDTIVYTYLLSRTYYIAFLHFQFVTKYIFLFLLLIKFHKKKIIKKISEPLPEENEFWSKILNLSK
jgi:hypothetical protein